MMRSPLRLEHAPSARGRLITDRLNDRDRHPAECRGEARVQVWVSRWSRYASSTMNPETGSMATRHISG